MAYGAVIKIAKEVSGDRRVRFNIHVTETEAESGSVWHTGPGMTGRTMTFEGEVVDSFTFPSTFTVRQMKADSTEATINPILGTPSTPGTFSSESADCIYEAEASADRPSLTFVHEYKNGLVGFPPDRGARYLSGRSQSSGTDTVVTHIILDQDV